MQDGRPVKRALHKGQSFTAEPWTRAKRPQKFPGTQGEWLAKRPSRAFNYTRSFRATHASRAPSCFKSTPCTAALHMCSTADGFDLHMVRSASKTEPGFELLYALLQRLDNLDAMSNAQAAEGLEAIRACSWTRAPHACQHGKHMHGNHPDVMKQCDERIRTHVW